MCSRLSCVWACLGIIRNKILNWFKIIVLKMCFYVSVAFTGVLKTTLAQNLKNMFTHINLPGFDVASVDRVAVVIVDWRRRLNPRGKRGWGVAVIVVAAEVHDGSADWSPALNVYTSGQHRRRREARPERGWEKCSWIINVVHPFLIATNNGFWWSRLKCFESLRLKILMRECIYQNYRLYQVFELNHRKFKL